MGHGQEYKIIEDTYIQVLKRRYNMSKEDERLAREAFEAGHDHGWNRGWNARAGTLGAPRSE